MSDLISFNPKHLVNSSDLYIIQKFIQIRSRVLYAVYFLL